MSIASILKDSPAVVSVVDGSSLYTSYAVITGAPEAVPANATGSVVFSPSAYVFSATAVNSPVGQFVRVNVWSDSVTVVGPYLFLTGLFECYIHPDGYKAFNPRGVYSSNSAFVLAVTGGNTVGVGNTGSSATATIVNLTVTVEPVYSL